LRKASFNRMTPSCSLVDPIMTRTSRARIRPFTRICGCRLDQAPHRRNGSAPCRRVSIYRNSWLQHSLTPGHSVLATAAIRRDEVLALQFASRTEVVGNNFALARPISQRLRDGLAEITPWVDRQSALCAPRTQPHRPASNRLSLPAVRVLLRPKKWRGRQSPCRLRRPGVA